MEEAECCHCHWPEDGWFAATTTDQEEKELKRRRGEISMMKTKSGIFREILQGIGIMISFAIIIIFLVSF